MRFVRRAVVLGLVLGLAVPAPALARQEQGEAVAVADPRCDSGGGEGTGATTEAVAVARATACDTSVEILGRRTETDQLFAEPDGSTTLRRYVTPQRVRRGDDWAPVDTTLRRLDDGTVAPAAVPFDLRLSGGGTAPLVEMSETIDTSETGGGDAALAPGWPDALPAPVLDGDTATYPDVLPGVDLRLTASVEGFQQVLVVQHRAAAANPRLARLTMDVDATGLDLRTEAGGRVEAVDAEGNTRFVSDGSAMWDSPASPADNGLRAALGVPATPVAEGIAAVDDGRAHRVAAMPVALEGDTMVIEPDVEMLQSADTRFPVYIDPPWSRGSGSNWTTVESCNASSSLWTSRRDTMRVGRNPDNGCKHRAFVNIATHDLAGTRIKQASFFSNMDHSSPCGSPTPEVRLSVTTQQWIQPGNAVTWNNTSSYADYWGWVLKIVRPSSANESWNGSRWSCGADLGDKLVEWGGDVRDPNNNYVPDVLQWFTDRSYHTVTFGVYASAESSANDYLGWKKFYADSSFLQVTYNRYPDVPTGATITDCTVRCAAPAVVSRRDPQLRTLGTDPDGGNLNVTFEVQKADGTPVATSPAVAYAAGSATPAQWRIDPALPADGAYRWRARTCDEWGDCSGLGGWFDFTVDTQAPAAPSVTPVDPDVYFADDGSGRSSGGIGVPGQLTLRGDASVHQFTWQLDGGPATTVGASGTDPRTATITVTPQADNVRTLVVKAKDHAGLESSRTYRFRVAPPDPQAGYWDLNGDAQDSRPLEPGDLRHDGTVTGPVTWTNTAVPGDVQTPRFRGAHFDATTGSIATAHPVLATAPDPGMPGSTRSFSVAAWVRFDGSVADNRYYTAVSQGGTNKSLFELGYQTGAESNFCFSMFEADAVNAPTTRACVATPVVTGEWVHLAGVFDDATDTARVYVHRLAPSGFVDVDGAATATRPFTTTAWAATGPFLIGRAQAGAPWKGVVDEVYAAQYAASAEDVRTWAQAFETAE